MLPTLICRLRPRALSHHRCRTQLRTPLDLVTVGGLQLELQSQVLVVVLVLLLV